MNRRFLHAKFLTRSVLFFLSLCACGLLFVPSAYAETRSTISTTLDGYGTQEFPYLITDEEDLDLIRDVINSGDALVGQWFALTHDLDLQGHTIEPLSDQSNGMSFQGGFDGRGYTISNFSMTSPNSVSFFGRLDGVVVNLCLNGKFDSSVTASFANQGYGAILNCLSTSSVSAKALAGGIVNSWNGTIQNVVFTGTLNSPSSSAIVNGGSGTMDFVYSQDYALGNITATENRARIGEIGVGTVCDTLNQAAQSAFLSSPFGKHLFQWAVVENRLTLSRNFATFDGTGSRTDPLIIDTPEKLKALADFIDLGNSFDGIYFLQAADLDLSGIEWDFYAETSVPFGGIYNGDGYTISFLHSKNTATGLFKVLNGQILNLKMVNCSTTYASGFAALYGEDSFVANSYFKGVLGDESALRQLQNSHQLLNCYIDGMTQPTAEALNAGLKDLVINYAFHCGDLLTWADVNGSPAMVGDYKDSFLARERLYWKGQGSEHDPYQIGSLEDFVYLRESVFYNESFWRYWFIQTADIDLSGVQHWEAISGDNAKYPFYGYYNGDGKEIKNFSQESMAATSSETLFGSVSGTVMNLHVTNCTISGNGNGILAYNVASTAKIMNNVIELAPSSSRSVASLVHGNSGRLLNNLLFYSSPLTQVTAVQDSAVVSSTTGLPEVLDNQIISSLAQENIDQFNANTVDTALHIKQRISNLNLLQLSDKKLSLKTRILEWSPTHLLFLQKLVLGSPLLLISVILLVFCTVFCILYFVVRLFRRSFSQSDYAQLSLVLLLYLLFVYAMYQYKPDAEWDLFSTIVTWVAGVLLAASVILFVIKSVKSVHGFSVKSLVAYIPLLCALIITTAIIAANYDIPIAYDSDLYYGSFIQSMQNFRFTLAGFADSFCIASKPMHGIAMLMALGEVFFPGTGLGVYIVNTVLMVVAEFSIYKVMQRLFPRLKPVILSLLVLIFAFSGYVLVGATYINPDFYSVVTFAVFIFCILYHYNIAAVFVAFLVLCSKPNMIVAYGCFLLIPFICEIVKKQFRLGKWVALLFPISVYLVLYFGVDSLNRAGVPAQSNNTILLTAASRFFQYFAFGFIWIQEIFILAVLIYLLKTKKTSMFRTPKGLFLLAVWFACFSQLLITLIGGSTLQLCPRYLAVCAIKNVLLFALAMDELPLLTKGKIVVVPAFCALLFAQLFFTIDPSIRLLTVRKFDGLNYLVVPSTRSTGNDLTFYNYQYVQDARDGTLILANMDKEDIQNIYTDQYSAYKLSIGSSNIYAAYWDTARNCRTYLPNENCVRLKTVTVTQGISTRAEYSLANCPIVLRSSGNYAIDKLYLADRTTSEYGGFTVYWPLSAEQS